MRPAFTQYASKAETQKCIQLDPTKTLCNKVRVAQGEGTLLTISASLRLMGAEAAISALLSSSGEFL